MVTYSAVILIIPMVRVVEDARCKVGVVIGKGTEKGRGVNTKWSKGKGRAGRHVHHFSFRVWVSKSLYHFDMINSERCNLK